MPHHAAKPTSASAVSPGEARAPVPQAVAEILATSVMDPATLTSAQTKLGGGLLAQLADLVSKNERDEEPTTHQHSRILRHEQIKTFTGNSAAGTRCFPP